jgi:hypothetical protein
MANDIYAGVFVAVDNVLWSGANFSTVVGARCCQIVVEELPVKIWLGTLYDQMRSWSRPILIGLT